MDVPIYDSRAFRALERLGYGPLRHHCYLYYFEAFQRFYGDFEKLVKAHQDLSANTTGMNPALLKVRAADKALWMLGGK
ncbi:MAG TPA: hypothetical protein DEO85_16750 [Maritimibacter sp.]|nr:hypothetical protein [Maritimibacter sp.]